MDGLLEKAFWICSGIATGDESNSSASKRIAAASTAAMVDPRDVSSDTYDGCETG